MQQETLWLLFLMERGLEEEKRGGGRAPHAASRFFAPLSAMFIAKCWERLKGGGVGAVMCPTPLNIAMGGMENWNSRSFPPPPSNFVAPAFLPFPCFFVKNASAMKKLPWLFTPIPRYARVFPLSAGCDVC